MSHPPPHTFAHENDSTLETKHQQQRNHMITVIKNSAQGLCLHLRLFKARCSMFNVRCFSPPYPLPPNVQPFDLLTVSLRPVALSCTQLHQNIFDWVSPRFSDPGPEDFRGSTVQLFPLTVINGN